MLNRSADDPLERVRLAEELHGAFSSGFGCSEHYSELAERAIWALLAPFGWTSERLQSDGRQPSLLDFIVPDDAGPKHSPLTRVPES